MPQSRLFSEIDHACIMHSGYSENLEIKPAMSWRMHQARWSMLRSTRSRQRGRGFAVLSLAILLVGWMQFAVAGLHHSPQATSGVGPSSVNVALDHVSCPHALHGGVGQTNPDDGQSRDDGCSCPLCQSLRFAGVLPASSIIIPSRVASRQFIEFDAQPFNLSAPRLSTQPRAPPMSI